MRSSGHLIEKASVDGDDVEFLEKILRIFGFLCSGVNVQASHVFTKKPLDMGDDGGHGDLSNSVRGGDASISSGDGGFSSLRDNGSSTLGDNGSSRLVGGGDIFKQIARGGGNGSNFVSCNFWIGYPPSVC